MVKTRIGFATVLMGLSMIVVLLWGGTAASGYPGLFEDDEESAVLSGPLDFRDSSAGTNVTECPQAGVPKPGASPRDRRTKDDTERKGGGGDDIRVNQDYSCMPQDETALDRNPLDSSNYV